MPIVQSELAAKGVTFTNGFVSNPICCPARATSLTGLYSGHHGVWSDKAVEHGGFKVFHEQGAERHTIATVLRDAGYYTGFIGKYLNGYTPRDVAWVPPGWDVWRAMTTQFYAGTSFSIQGKPRTFGSKRYQTDILGQLAVEFIENAPATQPLFLYWAPHAPHRPATPAEQDKGTLAKSIEPWRPPSYDEADTSQKPRYVRDAPLWTAKKSARWDREQVSIYESLVSVDRWIGAILAALENTGRLSQTLIVFTSDNGLLLGEHRLDGKVAPYEESIRVPWIVRWDSAEFPAVGGTDSHLMVNTDFAPTFAAVAGTSMGPTDGMNFVPLLQQASAPEWRTDFLIEHGGVTGSNGAAEGITYCGVRAESYKYVQYWDGFEELYQLSSDPNELQNVAGDPALENVLTHYRQRARELCDPPPPGFTWSH